MNDLPQINCVPQKKELHRSLLLQTSLVRAGVKPAEILTLNHCRFAEIFDSRESGICAGQEAVLRQLALPWHALRCRKDASLILFFDEHLLSETLRNPANRNYLFRNGYANCDSTRSFLTRLSERFCEQDFPHEVGLFLGYPLKDVIGFISVRSRLTLQGIWRIYGKAEPSLRLMDRFRRARFLAEIIVSQTPDWDACVQKISSIKFLI